MLRSKRNTVLLSQKVCINQSAFFTALGAFLGWKGAWFGVMCLDYLSGTVASALSGQWAREGIKHKCGLILPMVMAWYIITELGSILENAVAMGAPVPGLLVRPLKVSTNIVASAGDLTAKDDAAADAAFEDLTE